MKKILQKAGQTIFKNSMLAEGDRVLVALSGGKDSYILLEVLVLLRKKLPFPIELFAMHVIVKEAGYMNNLEYMEQLCKKLEVPLKIIETNVDLNQDEKKSPCFVCSWHRRKAIFNYTKEIQCNKLAFGHHMDDALQTYMLNMVYHGSLSSLPYKLSMFEGRVQLIRPLLDIDENELLAFAEKRLYPKELQKCPFDKATKRNEVKKLLESIYDSHRLAKINLFRSVRKICLEYLPIQESEKK